MIFRCLDTNGDWTFGKGVQNYLRENDAIAKNIETKLKQFYSECFFAPTDGIPWFNVLGSKDSTPLLVALRTLIMNCYGVVRIADATFSIDSNRKLNVTYVIDTIYSTGVIGGAII
jgi:hypothetical protein